MKTKKAEIKTLNAIPAGAYLLGTGWLNWPGDERRSDRYGKVCLLDGDHEKGKGMPLKVSRINERGCIIAQVLEARKSKHVGDLFRGIFPSMPKAGDIIQLGEGVLFYEPDSEGADCLGLIPLEPGVESDWLDPHALYRLHEQTVSLYFIPSK